MENCPFCGEDEVVVAPNAAGGMALEKHLCMACGKSWEKVSQDEIARKNAVKNYEALRSDTTNEVYEMAGKFALELEGWVMKGNNFDAEYTVMEAYEKAVRSLWKLRAAADRAMLVSKSEPDNEAEE